MVEIGAGTGALTSALLARGARLLALEVDPELCALLREREDLRAAEFVCADALTFDYRAALGDEPWTAAGNLPYNVATPLLGRWLDDPRGPQRVVATVQRDVAERLIAVPGSPSFGSLSLLVAYRARARRALVLGASAFHPRPRVASAVVVLERRATPAVAVADEPFFLQVVRAGFAYRRKTLANSLALALGIERARTQAILAALFLDTEIRAEQLGLDGFAALSDRLAA